MGRGGGGGGGGHEKKDALLWLISSHPKIGESEMETCK